MPCSDSSSSIALILSPEGKFISFEFAKITCGREVSAQTGYSTYCVGKSPEEILEIPFLQAVHDLKKMQEEEQFVLFLEWDALRTTMAQYLGVDHDEIDCERCKITTIEHSDKAIEIALVIFPPKELPKILPCSLVQNR